MTIHVSGAARGLLLGVSILMSGSSGAASDDPLIEGFLHPPRRQRKRWAWN
jgi:hypothetical protein